MKNNFYLIPLISSTIFSIVILGFFISSYSGFSDFFAQNKNTNGSLMILVGMLLVAVIASILASVISIMLVWSNGERKSKSTS